MMEEECDAETSGHVSLTQQQTRKKSRMCGLHGNLDFHAKNAQLVTFCSSSSR